MQTLLAHPLDVVGQRKIKEVALEII